MAKKMETFDEFWPFYVRAHSKKLTRQLHFVGTSLALACVAGAILGKRRWMLPLAPFAGYTPAWVSHFFIEHNRPTTFKHPLWSLKADFVMWGKIIEGTMDAEVERVLAEARAEAAQAAFDADDIRPNMATDGTLH